MHKYSELCTLFEKIELMQSRNEMSLELANFLKKCNSQEVEIISYMIQGRVAPMFVKSEFNYSEKSLTNLLSTYFSLDVASLRKESGDIGDTIFELLNIKGNASKGIDILEIYKILWEIVNTNGTGSVLRKDKIVLECLKELNPLEGKYFVRTICGELRLGLSVRSLLDVFSIAEVGDKGLKEKLEHAYGVCADIGYIGKKVFEDSSESVEEILTKISAIPGTPILSRLVQRVGGFEELAERFKESALLQPKFDGLRCQIHKWVENEKFNDLRGIPIWREYTKDSTKSSQNLFDTNDFTNIQVKLFTRNLEDVTEMFPEIVDSAKRIEKDSFILDSEVVGWNYKANKFMSYQETMQRRRKYSVQTKSTDIPVKAFTFDLLYLDKKSLININTEERVKLLENTVQGTEGGIVLADTKRFSKHSEVKKYFDKCVKDGLEGIIVKQSSGGYKPGIRNYEWIKIKKSIDKELVDTIDMVIIGYLKGSGRRSSFGLGAILGAIYNEEEETYDAICKIGTGMSDEILGEMGKKLVKYSTKNKPKDVRLLDNLIPDVWVIPKYVITVDADEITKNISNTDKSIGGGLSLRFPRLIEFDRDKGVEDITTVEELIDMYKMRKKK